jgi:hypothetical protein
MHFGLGSTSQIDAIDVVWPDGSGERFPSVACDQVVTLQKGSGDAHRGDALPAP